MIKLVSNAKSFLMMAPYPLPPRNVLLVSTGGNWHQKKSNATFIVNVWTCDHCDISDSSNVITIRFYSGCSGKCITLVSTVSSLVTFKTTSLNWISLVMRQLILVWWIFQSNPRHLMVIIQCIYTFLICISCYAHQNSVFYYVSSRFKSDIWFFFRCWKRPMLTCTRLSSC